MKSQLNILKLVYPPISNQEAEWIKDDPEVQKLLKESNLYMVAQRQEGKYEIDEDIICTNFQSKLKAPFTFYAQNVKSIGEIDFNEILKCHGVSIKNTDLEFEFGEKLIRVWENDTETQERTKVVDWFTTEKFLFDKWRGHPGIKGFDNFRDLTKYHLHYVGISKKEDSLTRLVIKPHDKRIRILSNEYPKMERSRITDEMILFFFKIEQLNISIFDYNDDFNDILAEPALPKEKIVADAEKAFVNILKSKYNDVKFSQYPKGKDGLYNSGLTRYAYVIGEDITFTTDSQEIVGSVSLYSKDSTGQDMILIEGDTVSLVKN
ncbi:MAG: hypothetical protein V1747_03575 [Candidatus Omnitrophota bacterium]